MTLRRFTPLKASRGTVIPDEVRRMVILRDRGCVGPRAGLPGPCVNAIELDHVRASHGIGMKSETSARNLVSLCSSHHRYKTGFGREARPLLLRYLEEHG